MREKKIFTGLIFVVAFVILFYVVYLPPEPPKSSNIMLQESLTSTPPSISHVSTPIMENQMYKSDIKAYPNIQVPVQKYLTCAQGIEEIILKFDAYVKETFQKSCVPGAAVAVVYQNQTVYLKCLGVKRIGSSDPVDPNTVFQIGSCSKAFTSATIASLVDEGKIDWDDKVIQHYPKFKMYDPWVTQHITIRDLLCHRSGLPEHTGDELVLTFKYNTAESIYRMRFMKPDTEFRTTFEYNNILFTLAGEAATRASVMEWYELIAEKIFKPLEMNATSARFVDFVNSGNKVCNHMTINGTVMVQEPLDFDAMAPAGSISSSINDMVKWLRFQLDGGKFNGKQVVSPQSIAETHKPHIFLASTDKSISAYGLGWGVSSKEGRVFLEHAGSVITSNSYMGIILPDKLGVVFLSNEGPYGAAFTQALALTFYDLYLKGKSEIDYWPILKQMVEEQMKKDPYEHLPDKPTNATPHLPLEVYVGEYYSDYYGKITIVQNGSGLQLYPGNNPVPLNLTHWSGNVFKEELTNTAANFTVSFDGLPREVVVKMFDYGGRNGTFTR